MDRQNERQKGLSLESEPRRPHPYPLGALVLLAAALLFYVPWLLALHEGPSWLEPGHGSGEDRYSQAWATLIVLVLGAGLWLLIGGLVLFAWRKRFAPPVWAAASGILYVTGIVAVFGAAQTYFTWPGGWSFLVPVLLPPLLALYCVCVPALAVGPLLRIVPLLALAGVALVALAAIPFALIDPAGYPARLARHQREMDALFARRDAEAQEAALRWEAGIRNLGPDSPLADWLAYVNGSVDTEPLHQQALEGARRAKSRQADAVELLNSGQIRKLAALSQLSLTVTPVLCTAYNQALYGLATTDEPFEARIGEQLERQLSNIRFLVAGGCDLSSGLAAAETRARKVAAVNPGEERWAQFHSTLAGLRGGTTKPSLQ